MFRALAIDCNKEGGEVRREAKTRPRGDHAEALRYVGL